MNGAFLYAGAAGICAGIALALLAHIGALILTILFVAVLACLGLSFFFSDKKFIIVAVGICAALLGVARTESFLDEQAQKNLSYLDGKAVAIAGVVVNDPERREKNLHINIDVSNVDGIFAEGTVLAILNRDEKVLYGDDVVVSGVVKVPEAFETDTGHTFDYKGYLAVRGVSVMIQKAQLKSVERGGFSVQGSLFELKYAFERSIEKLFPEPDGALLEGVLLGERRGIPDNLQKAFVASGLVHVVVLSGYNISIVASAVFEMLKFLPRTLSFGGGALVMILFALMTGAGATTIRALIMALIALLAKYMGRSALALRSLAAAAAAMALWNPVALLHDPSFILSVLATFGLITLSPWVESRLPLRLSKFSIIKSIVGSTIAVQLFVLPALLYFTGVFSVLSVPANVLALPVVPFAMLLGFAAGFLGLLSPALAYAPALFGDLLLKWMILIAETTYAAPLSVLIVPEFSAWIVAALYVPLTHFAILKQQENVSQSRPS